MIAAPSPADSPRRPEAEPSPARTLAIIMGGGAGSRLFPLTKDRSKPAVPLAGKYRLVDIPISNCLNSGLRQVYVLTQFNSTSLHRHISRTYKFDQFNDGFVEILAAQQTPRSTTWYQGTADAVRQNLRYFLQGDFSHYLILSGDQLYRMDFREIMRSHLEGDAELTVATLPVSRERAADFGILETDDHGRIARFEEKPGDPALLDTLRLSETRLAAAGLPAGSDQYLASMGIYLFNRETLATCLDNDFVDFGKHIIPRLIREHRVQSHVFQGYWEDIGTIRSFFEANLDLCRIVPNYDFFNPAAPIFTHPRFLPASKINKAVIDQSIVSDGCIITNSTIEHSLVGVRSVVDSGSLIRNTIVMGCDYFEKSAPPAGLPRMGIGRDCRIETAIIDKNARIGDRVHISPSGKPENMDAENFYIRDGIVVIPKDAVIPSDTWI
jgi:glucose-1-phosphate adenylyltransferase